ncbi:MAG: cobalamin B12-binding domain-containing protein [Planctomycetota bacterium]
MIATAVSGDLHALGVRMVAEFFEMDGWDVMYLGANTPGPDIVRALSDHTADLLAVSATSFLNLRQVGELIDAVRSDPGLAGVRIIVGGAPFNLVPDLWDELGADASAASAPDAVETANRLFDS